MAHILIEKILPTTPHIQWWAPEPPNPAIHPRSVPVAGLGGVGPWLTLTKTGDSR